MSLDARSQRHHPRLDRQDGSSLSETGWIRPQDHQFYFEVTVEKDGHWHIARAPDRETAVAQLGLLIGYPLDEQAAS